MLKKFLKLENPVKLYLLWGLFYYIEYQLFQQFLPLKFYNRQFSRYRLKSQEVNISHFSDCQNAYKLLRANLSALSNCRCRTYVAFYLYRQIFPALKVIYASKLMNTRLSGHCWVSCPDGTNLSDLYREDQGFTEIYSIHTLPR